MKSVLLITVSAFVILGSIQPCLSYPTGAPLQACQEMRPYHPPTTTSGSPPFAINISTAVYKPDSEIKGTIYSPGGVIFRGFLIQARKADNSSTTPIGEFIVSGTNTHTNCGEGNKQGLTHTTNSNKTKIDFTWQAPPTSMGDIHFKMTVVESYNVSRFWLGIYSEVIKDCSLHTSAECNEITTEIPTTKPGGTTGTVPVETSSSMIITTTDPGNKIQNDPDCGVTKGCFPDCSNGCDYLVTWQGTGDAKDAKDDGADDTAVHFSLQMMMKKTENVWTAIGLSPTGKMDDTNVIACLSEVSGVSVESSHNEGYQNVMYSNKTLGLANMQGRAEHNKISCSFTRAKMMNVTDFINLNDKVYLLVGSGPVSNGIKLQHFSIPVRSSGKVDFLSTNVSKEADSATPLVKLHGSLMSLAWVLFSSIGIVVARHFKSMAQGNTLCDVRYWFMIHRTLMFIVLVCVIVAFVAVFYEVGGFSKITAEPGKEYTKAHPYLGIIVTALTLSNPIMALFRPSLTHKNRPIFNWAHFSVGTLAHITAVVTIFFGIKLSKAKVNSYAIHVMISYSAIFIIVQFVLEVHRRINDSGDILYGRLNSNSIKHSKVSDDSNKVRSVVLLVHTVAMVVAATLLVLMICIPAQFPTT